MISKSVEESSGAGKRKSEKIRMTNRKSKISARIVQGILLIILIVVLWRLGINIKAKFF